ISGPVVEVGGRGVNDDLGMTRLEVGDELLEPARYLEAILALGGHPAPQADGGVAGEGVTAHETPRPHPVGGDVDAREVAPDEHLVLRARVLAEVARDLGVATAAAVAEETHRRLEVERQPEAGERRDRGPDGDEGAVERTLEAVRAQAGEGGERRHRGGELVNENAPADAEHDQRARGPEREEDGQPVALAPDRAPREGPGHGEEHEPDADLAEEARQPRELGESGRHVYL